MLLLVVGLGVSLLILVPVQFPILSIGPARPPARPLDSCLLACKWNSIRWLATREERSALSFSFAAAAAKDQKSALVYLARAGV